MPKSLDLSNAADQHLGAERADRVVERSDADTLLGRTRKVLAKGQPVTDQARRLEGVGTGLKPGFEPIMIARKPVEGSIVSNVLTNGSGGLNIDDCRTDSRRWPVNVGLDEQIAHELDVATGTRWSSASTSQKFQVFSFDGKAPQVERPRAYGVVHTTVKPLSLMRWLVRLVAPGGGVVLESFAGSDSTIEAALLEGRRMVTVEKDPLYVGLISQRIRRVAPDQLSAPA